MHVAFSGDLTGTAYIHLVGVDPSVHRAGIGTRLHHRFFGAVARRGATTVRCITSPGNAASVAFHTRPGFRIDAAEERVADAPVQQTYDGPGLDRVTSARPPGTRHDSTE